MWLLSVMAGRRIWPVWFCSELAGTRFRQGTAAVSRPLKFAEMRVFCVLMLDLATRGGECVCVCIYLPSFYFSLFKHVNHAMFNQAGYSPALCNVTDIGIRRW